MIRLCGIRGRRIYQSGTHCLLLLRLEQSRSIVALWCAIRKTTKGKAPLCWRLYLTVYCADSMLSIHALLHISYLQCVAHLEQWWFLVCVHIARHCVYFSAFIQLVARSSRHLLTYLAGTSKVIVEGTRDSFKQCFDGSARRFSRPPPPVSFSQLKFKELTPKSNSIPFLFSLAICTRIGRSLYWCCVSGRPNCKFNMERGPENRTGNTSDRRCPLGERSGARSFHAAPANSQSTLLFGIDVCRWLIVLFC